jgi:hypothetical protein
MVMAGRFFTRSRTLAGGRLMMSHSYRFAARFASGSGCLRSVAERLPGGGPPRCRSEQGCVRVTALSAD